MWPHSKLALAIEIVSAVSGNYSHGPAFIRETKVFIPPTPGQVKIGVRSTQLDYNETFIIVV